MQEEFQANNQTHKEHQLQQPAKDSLSLCRIYGLVHHTVSPLGLLRPEDALPAFMSSCNLPVHVLVLFFLFDK